MGVAAMREATLPKAVIPQKGLIRSAVTPNMEVGIPNTAVMLEDTLPKAVIPLKGPVRSAVTPNTAAIQTTIVALRTDHPRPR